MKKIYLCAMALSVGSMSFGQTSDLAKPRKNVTANNTVKSPTLAPQDKGTVLWSNDLATPADWNMTANVGADNWIMGDTSTVKPTGAFAIPNVVSTDGKIAMFDSDLMCSGGQDAQLTIVNPITVLGSEANVSVVFNQYYRRFQDSTFVIVSLDGTNWTKFRVNDVAVNAFGDGTTATPNANPHSVSVNVSSVAGSQPSVYIGFLYQGGCDYAWMIDNVEIQVTENNDLVASNAYYGTANVPYTRIPVLQIQPIDFVMMKTENVGAVAQTNTILTATVSGTAFAGTSAPVTVMPGATADSLFTTTSFVPPVTLGIPYTATLTVSSDSTDFSPADNAIAFPPFEVSQYIYAQDDYGTTGIGNGGGADQPTATGLDEFEAGNYYDVYVDDIAYSINVTVGTNSGVNGAIDAVLYEIDGTGTFIQVDRSNPYVITAADVVGGVELNLMLPNTPNLTAGKFYFAAVHAYGGGTEFFYGTSGTSPDNSSKSGPTSLIYYPNMTAPAAGGNYFTSQTPMVRLSFDGTTGVELDEANNVVNFSVYPNPSNGKFTIALDSDVSENATMTVKNIVGQTIINKTVRVAGKTTQTISLTDYSKGVYFLTVNNETVKLIVE